MYTYLFWIINIGSNITVKYYIQLLNYLKYKIEFLEL